MKRITLFLVSILCYTACNNEIVIPVEPQETQPRQPLELFMPDADMVSVYSTATVSECMIDTVWVLVFNGNTKRWVEKIGRSAVMNNGQATQLLPQLKHKIENGNTVICVANVAPNPDTTSVTPNNINTCFKTKTLTHYDGDDYLPVYGKIDSWSPTGSYTCRMTRAVAKIQVQMGIATADVPTDFRPDNVTYEIRNISSGGYVQSGSTPTGIPGAAGVSTSSFKIRPQENATEAETNAFIYEYQSGIHTIDDATTDIGIKNFHIKRPHIILTKGTGVGARYYRLDFYNRADSSFLDIIRNHHYIFTINKVSSEGYTTVADAQNNPGSNIEYTISVKDGSQAITSNGQYAIVTSVDTVKVSTSVMNQAVATFRYIDPTGAMNTSVNSISVESVRPDNALTIEAPTGANPITNASQELKITSYNLVEGVILFRLGNISHRLYVRPHP
jgi:hypothetical protein